MTVECENHDYNLLKGDKLLAFIRRVFKKWPEFRHDSLKHVARFAPYLPFLSGKPDFTPELKTTITFPDKSNPIVLSAPIILAAGANKTALRVSDYANLGFGGVSVGTATRHFRKGNTHRPRVGFLEEDRAIYNSMGLNNDGVEVIAKRVSAQIASIHKSGMSVGISVAETPGLSSEKEKITDVLESFAIAYPVGDYIEINASCPNTGENRLDLDTQFIEHLFSEIMKYRDSQSIRKAVYAKLSPDFSENQLLATVEVLVRSGVNGVIVGNTFPTKKMGELPMFAKYDELKVLRADGDKGGLSGRPLYLNTYSMTQFVKSRFPQLSVIACGGIDHGEKVFDLMQAGADAVECYSVCAFRWMPAHAMRKELFKALRRANAKRE
ncbi:MAG: dihydroorotate oxidase [Hallerella porci]|uniref:Dihydroorotate oxidase A n=1 Tax=Hallerella porci TaxID=1945871 RepID=A0ABX5LR88_9BACT|nr:MULTISPECIES: dihydroorotate oxidase [Hallerella]MCI5601659.1 dihydroorotate oxidase [Hallerella sp.]MDY3921047.1 dihydroorotate oxidase [Hallerella porci]PWL03798.1 dihydroorotate oxidase A [Hallerella porci]